MITTCWILPVAGERCLRDRSGDAAQLCGTRHSGRAPGTVPGKVGEALAFRLPATPANTATAATAVATTRRWVEFTRGSFIDRLGGSPKRVLGVLAGPEAFLG